MSKTTVELLARPVKIELTPVSKSMVPITAAAHPSQRAFAAPPGSGAGWGGSWCSLLPWRFSYSQGIESPLNPGQSSLTVHPWPWSVCRRLWLSCLRSCPAAALSAPPASGRERPRPPRCDATSWRSASRPNRRATSAGGMPLPDSRAACSRRCSTPARSAGRRPAPREPLLDRVVGRGFMTGPFLPPRAGDPLARRSLVARVRHWDYIHGVRGWV
jgi:hypothetical protein